MSAAGDWRAMVEAEEAQAEGLRTDKKGDYWQGLSGLFLQDPRRRDDREVETLAALIDDSSTVIDVGAGAGRLALPLALRCRRVTAVEPSPAMGAELRKLQAEHGIQNLDIVEEEWVKAQVEDADLVFAAHVVYTIKDIGGFVDRMSERARGLAALILWVRAPLYSLNPFWREVYGVDRLNLPSLPELLEVLWERGVSPQLDLLPPVRQRGWADKESAAQMLRHRLFIGDDQQELLARLRKAVDGLLVETAEGWTVKDAPMRAPILVRWPGKAR